MGFLIALTYAVFFIYLIHRLKFFRWNGISPFSISLIFFLKLLFGAVLWLVYTYYYPERQFADIFKYYDDALVLFEASKSNLLHYLQILTGINADSGQFSQYFLETSHWHRPYDYGIYNDNRTIIRLILLLIPFSLGYYAPLVVFFCFMSLIGLMGIFKTACYFLKERQVELVFAVFLLPSMLFWSSGVLKEAILIFVFGLFVYYLFKTLFVRISFKYLIKISICMLLLSLVKGYVLLALTPAFFSLLAIKASGNKKPGLIFLTVHFVLLILAINLYRVSPKLDVLFYLHQKQQDFINVGEQLPAGSYIPTRPFEPHWVSLFANMPEAITNALFRPTIFEANSFMMGISALENFFVILICGLFLINFRKPEKEKMPLFWFSVFFTVSLAAIIGFVTPVLGAVVRYKIPLMPFLMIAFIIISDKERMVNRFPFLKFLNKKL